MNAHDTYTIRKANCERLLTRIKAGLREHAKQERSDPQNWGYAGDLDYIQELLTEASNFLHGEGEYTP